MAYPHIALGTPRKLPSAKGLPGRVVVLDIAFAANMPGGGFDKVTRKFLDGLGDRLAMWVDHHDHALHGDYRDDPRFLLRTKAQHGACPEMITPELVASVGEIDTICCHTDFDGLCAAAKWIRQGIEPYEGADADAHAIDTRLGKPSALANTLDRALRGQPRDHALRGLMVRFLADGGTDRGLLDHFGKKAVAFGAREDEARRLAKDYELLGDVAVVNACERRGPYDKTTLLLLGQERAPISVVHDESTVTAAARFDSGIDLLALLEIDGGMPTRVSVPAKRLSDVIERLRTRER